MEQDSPRLAAIKQTITDQYTPATSFQEAEEYPNTDQLNEQLQSFFSDDLSNDFVYDLMNELGYSSDHVEGVGFVWLLKRR